MRLGFAVKVLGEGGLPSHDTRRWQSGPHLRTSLTYLRGVLEYLDRHDIRMYRMATALAPYASHPELPQFHRQVEECEGELAELGALARDLDIRLSTHPGQYTVLGSARPEVVDASLGELEYQALLLRSFGLDESHKMVIHLSGTSERFLAAVARLSADARARLVVENDERWSLEDVLALGLTTVFDTFHHQLRPSLPELDVRGATLLVGETWTTRQEVHFSTQDPGKHPGAHSASLDPQAFEELAREVGDLEIDCMLEVKDKERSALLARDVLDRTA